MVNQIAPNEDKLGPYRLLSALGKGGMAEVWKAEHRHLGQVRALKILLPEVAARPELVDRLLTEARATARLRHPAIVEVFDCDVLETGGAFIAMEYLRGEHLRAWLDRIGKLSGHVRLAAALLGKVADGLDFAHRQGVVHRDLKPENLFLVPLHPDRGRFTVKVLDFGIAKLLREEAPNRTRPGCVVGTPIYMAPEQWQPGETIDHRADLYALGCLLFEMLSGRPPFPYRDDVSMMRAHLSEPAPDLAVLEPNVPAPLVHLTARLLAKPREARPNTMAEVLAVVEAFLGVERARFGELLRAPPGFPVSRDDLPLGDGTSLSPAPSYQPRPATVRSTHTEIVEFQRPRWRGRAIALGAGLGALGLAALGLALGLPGGGEADPARARDVRAGEARAIAPERAAPALSGVAGAEPRAVASERATAAPAAGTEPAPVRPTPTNDPQPGLTPAAAALAPVDRGPAADGAGPGGVSGAHGAPGGTQPAAAPRSAPDRRRTRERAPNPYEAVGD